MRAGPSPVPVPAAHTSRGDPDPFAPEALAHGAVETLITEACLTPKPGLVDLAGGGAHDDMDVAILVRSAHALRPAFSALAHTAAQLPPGPRLRARIGEIGRDGEARMMAASGGVNTHRGALWALGLLVSGAAICRSADASQIARTAGALARLADPGRRLARPSHGARARAAFGAGGAPAEACAGFPHVVNVALPVLQAAGTRAGVRHARLDALLAVMARLDDTCVLHRSGPEGLRIVHRRARGIIECGGTATDEGWARLLAFDAELTRLGISPGGSADMLAAALLLERIARAGGVREHVCRR